MHVTQKTLYAAHKLTFLLTTCLIL